mmetsp:Transcript_16082/g.33009  ORF Transcript_16082/g.33009 Transcript_16082/m.33009 type:complete len:634 (+) Transcript_16082:132-2033(+)|eukprot:CAMPEP_0201249134 /NCGR_PEP_ID=MMETSP0852-20130820/58721_1 /ASSEMBLY_ACC=CAM_ASM_000632 /TAXON_ID=183588 /ORGANISM="Pseudo-nitzschia fraudulenta, Strain WWA7" /LENGTH=633 /DNA_ID=CAMNT_0047548079 /DNA_START=55 /DNA_END=1956 /DNA_ORIENTATION=+
MHPVVGIEDDGFDRLKQVSEKRSAWADLSVLKKIEILKEMQEVMTKELDFRDWKLSGEKGAEMMGFDVNTTEGGSVAAEQTMALCLIAKKQVDDLIRVYCVRAGLAKPPKNLTKGNFETRKAINGQVVAKTFPMFPEDSKGISAHLRGEVWMDASQIQKESQVEAFAFDKAWVGAAGKEGALMMVLGAGNQPMLTFVDTLHAMFTRNYVVYLKQHPLRNYLVDIYEKLLDPLISRKYLAIETHSSNDRSAALLYHKAVDAVHITGGKATHDLIVWGADEKERERNLKANTPKLQHITSELGAVSPWVVIPARYTKAEMKAQASILALFVHSNASCNCNSPKCVVVAEDWDQKDEFLQLIEDELASHPLPAAYYPGVEKRWKTFSDEYPDAKKIDSNTGMGVIERKLCAGGLNEKPLLLPFLKVETEVNLDSPGGKENASKEFIFKTEPFAPIYAIVTLQGTSQDDLMKFSKTSAVFCNDYLFGTLSGTITTPDSLLDDEGVQTLIADMKYGSITVNNWSGFGYLLANAGMWGAFPGETLDDVRSGIGKIGNVLAIPYFEKFVVVSPITHMNHASLKKDLKKEEKINYAVTKFLLDESMGNLIRLIGASMGVDLVNVVLFCTSVAVASYAVFYG